MNPLLQAGSRRRRQRGAALIVTLLLFTLIGVTTFLALARGADSEADKERRTSEALALARAALIGFAAGVPLTGPERPGDLPCPDRDNDGSAELSCGPPDQRLGRLPWKTLGLPDLRDGDGERLWYAVSDHFANNPRTPCGVQADPGCLNSDTRGTISVRDASGTLVYDANGPNPITHNGLIAVVIAPGGVVRREDGIPQLRDGPAVNTAANYLEVLQSVGEDNANFIDRTTNGFVAGPVTDANGRIIVNDRILGIGRQDLMPVVERRVAQEVGLCLRKYAEANGGKYPYAADMVDSGLLDNYSEDGAFAARRYGRVPTPPFTRTNTVDGSMGALWVDPACKLPNAPGASWWTNWKPQVLYAIAQSFQPGGSANCAVGGCLTVNRPNGPASDVRMVVMVAGRAIPGQDRGAPYPTVNTNPINYVEFENVTDPVFEIRASAANFNDRLTYFPIP